jgi:thiol-disulfide isomerase/thioredoxin
MASTGVTGSTSEWCGFCDAVAELEAQLAEKDAEIARLREALTPSQKTKAAYIGEFRVPYSFIDENEDERCKENG